VPVQETVVEWPLFKRLVANLVEVSVFESTKLTIKFAAKEQETAIG